MNTFEPGPTEPSANRGVNRRSLLTRGGVAAAGLVVGAPLLTASPATAAGRGNPFAAARPSGYGQTPPATRPGGAYDKYLARLAEQGKFSGVMLLSHQGNTVLSRSYGMADEEKRIPNSENTAFDLSSAGQPFLAVAVMQLVQAGKLSLSDTVGQHLAGFAKDVATQVNVHQLLTSTSGLSALDPDPGRTFHSKAEVHHFYEQWARGAKLVAPPGASNQGHTSGAGAALAIAALIVEARSGMSYWDYAQTQIFRRAGMTGSSFYTTSQWLTDPHIAHAYMLQPDGRLIDAVRNLDKESLSLQGPHENPARSYIGYGPSGGFATAPDLVRFAQALYDGTLLSRPYTDVLFGAKLPGPVPSSYATYTMPIQIIRGPQWVFGRGGSTGGVGANWNIYPDTGWVGVLLTNRDDGPFLDILEREANAITGQPIPKPGTGGG